MKLFQIAVHHHSGLLHAIRPQLSLHTIMNREVNLFILFGDQVAEFFDLSSL